MQGSFTLNKKFGFTVVTTCLVALSGCSGFVKMMPRDSGKIYSGTVQSGTMTVLIDGESFTGPIVRTGSNDSVGFIQQYGSNTGSTTGMVAVAGGTASVKAMLSSLNGRGLRCEFSSDGSGGGGVCIDDNGRVLDAIVGR